jgi:putative addiction module component (TIGR02574 family)
MSGETTSVFDLSPAEKLQLVEDLWDDLAANPDDVPVHQWHKDELARRDANLQKNSASSLSWEEVKRKTSNHPISRDCRSFAAGTSSRRMPNRRI